ncbi:MAG: ring-hydroxylating oxygenase subunit alpha [Gammaproteobacteria bacterium]|nr:MAG: ring-hydroxylating oxygenase subunit alpha [Gammaproteobacteria bacterium]
MPGRKSAGYKNMPSETVVELKTQRPVHEQAQHSYTIPSSLYLDEKIYEQEKQNIFYCNWHYAGHASQLSKTGDYLTASVADESVFIVRCQDETLRGFYNVCRHRAHQLLEGSGNTHNIVCPYHAWSYALTGELRHARNSEKVPGFDKSEFCLQPVQVDTLCDFVFFNLDLEADSLNNQAPGLEQDLQERLPNLDQMKPLDTFTYGPAAMAANWKVVVDNFLECYHCAPAHPDFATLFDMSSYQMETFSNWSRQLGPDTRAKNTAYALAPDSPNRSGAFWYLWPTTTINLLPGEPYLLVLSFLPLDHERTSFFGHRYGLSDNSQVDAQDHYMNTVLGPEDAALCESVQKGLKSQSYDQGRFIVDPDLSGIAEHAVHQFHRLVLAALEPTG